MFTTVPTIGATDGTFNEHLPGIMRKIAQSNLSETGQEDLAYKLAVKLAVYNTWTTKAEPEQLVDAILTAFKEQEY